MRKLFMAVLLFIAVIGFGLLVFTFLNPPEVTITDESTNSMSMEGIIAQIGDGRLLLVEGVTLEEIKGATESEILLSADSAAYFDITDRAELDNLRVGMKVRVWYDSLDTSNPAYGTGERVEVLE